MSSRRRRLNSPWSVALTTLAAFLEPSDLVRTSFTPADSRTAAHGLARNDTCAGGGRPQQHLRAAIVRVDFVRDGCVLERHADHLRTGYFAAFTNGIRHFPSLAQPNSHAAVLVANDDERTEIETSSAFNDFGGAIDEDHLLGQLLPGLLVEGRFRLRPAAPAAARSAGSSGLPRRPLLWLVQAQYSFPLYVRIADRLRVLRRPGLSLCHDNARRHGRKPLV